ncbi:hypothetical protein PspLS_10987 [Pyricularia sp. CBS 133598]|nr:hypothetical protein PspLS_10987 [Pyricularia sp. CBS 133598]
MSNAGTLNAEAVAKAHVPDAAIQGTEKEILAGRGSMDVSRVKSHSRPATAQQDAIVDSSDDESYADKPTEEELQTLRRVSGKIKWSLYTIAFAELCERFSYYGSAVLYTNFVVQKLPEGHPTGANPALNGRTGALGKGQAVGQAVSLLNQFLAYIFPLVGAYVADARLGRYVTIHIAIGVSTIAHAILTAASAPEVLKNPDTSFGVFFLGLLCLCIGTGFFKANISPLLAEQNEDTRHRVETLPSGERVIVDPAITNTRIFLWFYFAINIGAVTGQISMVFVSKHYGFWLAFLLPTVLFLLAPLILWTNKKNYKLTPPTGSVLSKFLKLWMFCVKRQGLFKVSLDAGKPSNVPIDQRPAWMTYDDAWVDEVRRGLMACKVFLFLPIFHLAYNQMTNNLTTQASTMVLNGAPNDLIQNLNPISIVIMVPIFDKLLYPGLRKIGFNFTPIKRMACGFFFGAFSMVAAAVMQHYIYQMSPCGMFATDPDCVGPAPINVWAQCLPYILVGISEIFTNVTSYEYAFSKAPENMKSLVMSVNLFMSAFASALGFAWVPLSEDPLLVWNYASIAIIAFIGGIAFWLCFKHLDSREDELNALKKTKYVGSNQPTAAEQQKLGAPAYDENPKV